MKSLYNITGLFGGQLVETDVVAASATAAYRQGRHMRIDKAKVTKIADLTDEILRPVIRCTECAFEGGLVSAGSECEKCRLYDHFVSRDCIRVSISDDDVDDLSAAILEDEGPGASEMLGSEV